MTRSNKFAAELHGLSIQRRKFYVSVAVNTRIGRQPVFVCTNKAGDDLPLKSVVKIKYHVFKSESLRTFPRVPRRCAGICQKGHCRTDAVKPRVFYERSRDRTVHAAAHGYKRLFVFHILRIIPIGVC